MWNRILLILLLAVPLLGFGSCQTKVVTPKVVYTTVEKMPKLSPEQRKLLEDCPIEEPKAITVEESVRVNIARRTALNNCNIDKKAIRTWFE